MPLEAAWWHREKSALAAALEPLGAFYGHIVEARAARATPYRSRLKVICIGNFTAGGAGKTPTAIAVAKLLTAHGARPYLLTRGYRGKSRGPLLVGQGMDAHAVGDEPLLLAEVAPTMVSADRVAGAKAIEATDASVIVMDDGFQNPSLTKDLSLIVVDAASGIGNGRIIPAGPLRAPLDAQIARADALLVIGEGGKAAPLVDAFARAGKPALKARIVPDCDSRWLSVLPAIVFAGIGRPEKAFATIRNNGARVIATHAFGDHHRYTEREARKLLAEAEAKKAMLVTTAKDWVRLPNEEGTALAELKHRARPFPVALKFEDEAAVGTLLATARTKTLS
jgi:tetraacyldisaccharide 4'-kinase